MFADLVAQEFMHRGQRGAVRRGDANACARTESRVAVSAGSLAST